MTPADQELHGVAPLNVENLRSCSSKIDKDRLLTAYIRSQKAHLAAYAAQGRAITAGWERGAEEIRSLVETGPSYPVVEPDARSETSVLKPRVPERRSGSKEKKCSGGLRALKISTGTEKVHRRAASSEGESNKENHAEKLIKHLPPLRSPPPQKSQHSKSKNETSKICDVSDPPAKKRGKKRPRSPEMVDDEHAARLAERRERRRVKKVIVDPADYGSSEEEQKEPSRRGKKRRKDKHSKGVSMAAGLALMHGFSATNVGRNRLTHKPDPVTGVFNKGKASTKVYVRRDAAKQKSPNKCFSESQFLSKTKPLSREIAAASNASSASDNTCDSSLNRASPEPPKPKAKMARKSKESEDHSEEDKPATQVTATPAKRSRDMPPRKKHNEKASSVVWDIELEGGAHASTSEIFGNRREVSVVLNTRSSKWAAAGEAAAGRPPSPDVASAVGVMTSSVRSRNSAVIHAAANPLNIPPANLRTSSPSLGPSQSASQPDRNLLSSVAMPNRPDTVSKFFAPLTQKAKDDVDDHVTKCNEISESPIKRSLTDEMLLIKECPTRALSPVPPFESLDQELSSAGDINGEPGHVCSSPMTMDSLDRELQALHGSDSPFHPAWPTARRYRHEPEAVDHHSVLQYFVDAQVDCEAFNGDVGYADIDYELDGVEEEDSLAQIPPNSWHVDPDVELDYPNFDYSAPIGYFHEKCTSCPSDAVDDHGIAFGNDAAAYIQEDLYSGMSACGLMFIDDNQAEEQEDFSGFQTPPQMGESNPAFGSSSPRGLHAAAVGNLALGMQSTSSVSSSLEDMSDVDRSPGSFGGFADVGPRYFSQGRALLLGMVEGGLRDGLVVDQRATSFDAAEQTVARSLRGHWLPQKP